MLHSASQEHPANPTSAPLERAMNAEAAVDTQSQAGDCFHLHSFQCTQALPVPAGSPQMHAGELIPG